jgi:hypothetical protein
VSVALPTPWLPLPRPSRVPNGTVVGVAFVAAANLACLAGAAEVVTPAMVIAAVGIGALLARVRPLAALELAVWLWLLGPQIRRVVDLQTGYHDPSMVLVAAPLVSLVALPHTRRLRHRGLQRAVRPLMVALVAIAAGYAVGALRIGLQPATAALLSWAVPVLFGLQVVAVSDDLAELRATVERVFVWGTLVVGIYGVVQFYTVPAWDAYWMHNVPMNSIGTPEPFAVRVFSTLNAPAPLAVYLAAAVLYLADADHRLRVPAQIAGYIALALSLVRAAWLACALGLVLLLITGRPRAKLAVLVTLTVVTVGVLQISGPLQTVIADRVEETREGREDDSFAERMDLHSRMMPTLADDIIGQGLGATGGASQLAADGSPRPMNLDSGLIDFGYSLGVPLALLALGALSFGGMDLARIGARGGVVSPGVVAGGLSVLIQMVFGNTLTGVGGVIFFLLWAHAVREALVLDVRARWAPA